MPTFYFSSIFFYYWLHKQSKNSWKCYEVYLGILWRVGKKQKRNGVYMPSPHPVLWIHVWLNLSYQSLLIAALNSFALWKRGKTSIIMWPGKVFGTLYYLLCKQVTGCKSTFGPGCILIKRYQDLENQTGCSFSITPKWKVETDSSKRSFKDNWNLTLHFRKSQSTGFTSTLCHTQFWPEELFWNPPTSEAHAAYSIYIHI